MAGNNLVKSIKGVETNFGELGDKQAEERGRNLTEYFRNKATDLEALQALKSSFINPNEIRGIAGGRVKGFNGQGLYETLRSELETPIQRQLDAALAKADAGDAGENEINAVNALIKAHPLLSNIASYQEKLNPIENTIQNRLEKEFTSAYKPENVNTINQARLAAESYAANNDSKFWTKAEREKFVEDEVTAFKTSREILPEYNEAINNILKTATDQVKLEQQRNTNTITMLSKDLVLPDEKLQKATGVANSYASILSAAKAADELGDSIGDYDAGKVFDMRARLIAANPKIPTSRIDQILGSMIETGWWGTDINDNAEKATQTILTEDLKKHNAALTNIMKFQNQNLDLEEKAIGIRNQKLPLINYVRNAEGEISFQALTDEYNRLLGVGSGNKTKGGGQNQIQSEITEDTNKPENKTEKPKTETQVETEVEEEPEKKEEPETPQLTPEEEFKRKVAIEAEQAMAARDNRRQTFIDVITARPIREAISGAANKLAQNTTPNRAFSGDRGAFVDVSGPQGNSTAVSDFVSNNLDQAKQGASEVMGKVIDTLVGGQGGNAQVTPTLADFTSSVATIPRNTQNSVATTMKEILDNSTGQKSNADIIASEATLADPKLGFNIEEFTDPSMRNIIKQTSQATLKKLGNIRKNHPDVFAKILQMSGNDLLQFTNALAPK